MMDAGRHPNITLLSYSEIEEVSGYVGNFQVKVRKKPRYVDETKCTGCAECSLVCPVKVPSEFEMGLGTRKAIYRSFPQAIPNAFVIDKRPSPCKVTCPAHIRVQGYIALIAQGKFDEALALIRETVPFPGVLGRVCHHPCEAECKRKEVDQALAICSLKRFAYDYAAPVTPVPVERTKEEKVAIIGAGPAGLAAAYDLVRKGYGVTVFEALPVAGGMMAVGIPDYRLPKITLQEEINYIKGLGVEIRLNTPVGKDLSLDDLKKDYQAIFLATGAHRGQRLNIPGEDLEGVVPAIEFLRNLNLGREVEVKPRVAVIGGGNCAIDAARSALRLGAQEVIIIYRRSRREMPAIESEIEEAEREGVKIHLLAAPTRLLGQDGKVTSLECIRMELGEPDESGRRRPVPIPASEFTIPVDMVMPAIGQVPDLPFLPPGIELTRQGNIVADPDTLATGVPGIFAGGDVVWGAGTVIEAIAVGKRAAESIDRYLRGEDLRAGRVYEEVKAADIHVEIPSRIERARRQEMPTLPIAERLKGFVEVEQGYTPEMAMAEAQRCLSCAVCSECLQCVQACGPRCIDHEMREEIIELDVGTIIVATGFQMFDPARLPEYSYGQSPNIIDGLQFERLSSATGPTGGQILTAEGKVPERVAIIHCVGSRDERANRYCSRVCCMYAMKHAHLVRDKTGAEVYEFYMDIRASGKGYEEFYERVQDEGVVFVRGRGAEVVVEPDGKLTVKAEDTTLGRMVEVRVDMVILETALVPQPDTDRMGAIFGLSRGEDGFFLEAHPKLRPVETNTDGIFLAGACQSPRDVPDTVAHANAAAAEALALLSRGVVQIAPTTAQVNEERCSGCGECVLVCPYNAISLTDHTARVNSALCKGCGTCAAACLAKAIEALHFTDEQIVAQIEALFQVAA